MDPNIYAVVLDTLQRATNQDSEILKPAEKKLLEWEIEPGFYSVLLSIFSDHMIDHNIRWLAVMCFKNGVDRYWRKNSPNAIEDDEKQRLRAGLLTTNILSEPVTLVASQLAELISRVARYDCPAAWPSLIPDLLGALKAPQPLIQHRALLFFHHIIKSLASKRLAGDKLVFQELTINIYSYMLGLWDEYTQNFLRLIRENSATELITENLEKALLCLRVLRKLTVFGMKKPHESQDAVAFLNVVFDRAKTSLECRKLLKGRGIYTLELCEKFIIHLTKVALGVLETHPFSYVSMIVPSLEFAVYFCFTVHGQTLIYERFTIQCLNLMKGILMCSEYKPAKVIEQTKEPATVRAHQAKLSVLTEETACHVCSHLVTHYFLLSNDDLALWDADPEGFATDEAGESWKYSLKPCTESLFMALFCEFRNILAPELVRLLTFIQQQPANPNDLHMILRKDAIYNAVGLAAFDLYDEIDFDEWFTKVLVQELKIKDNNYRIIRRRVAWLIGQWSGVRASPSLRPGLYEALLELLGANAEGGAKEDAAVRLAAADALRAAVDDFNFDEEQFAPYSRAAFAALYNLLTESDEEDTKMHVLHILSFIVECNGESVLSGHASDLLHYLPELWQHGGQHNMLRAAVVTALVHLIRALGEWGGGITLRPFVLSVVQEATTLSEPACVYLLEDGLALWLAALETASQPDAGLFDLAKNLPPLLDESSEYLSTVVYIMQAYTLLNPEEFLFGYGSKCMATLDGMLSDMRTEGILMVLKMAETCLKVNLPERNALLGVKVTWPILLKVVCGLQVDDELPMVLSLQLCLMSRVILKSSELFFKVVEEAATSMSDQSSIQDPTVILSRMLDVWTERMNLVTQVERRKVIGLGISALLTVQNTTVLQKSVAILLNMTEVLNDVMKMNENGTYSDSLLSLPNSRPPSPLGGMTGTECGCVPTSSGTTSHDIRRKTLATTDPAHALDTSLFFSSQLQTLRSLVGPEAFQQLLDSLETEVLQQLREYIRI